MAYERHDIVSCRSAPVDNKAAVLFRYLSTSDRIAAKTRVHDKFSRKIPFRSLEGAPGAGKIKRLL